MTSADNVNGLCMDGVRRKYVRLYQRGKIRVQVIFKLGMFSFIPRIVMSRIWVEFMFRFRVQILDPGYCKRIHTSIKISLYFFGFTLTLRSRSTVDLDEFFNKQGCIDRSTSGLSVSIVTTCIILLKLHQSIDLLQV